MTNNSTAKLLSVIAIVVTVVGSIGAGIIGSEIGDGLGLIGVVTCIITGSLIAGIAEIINLLQKILDRKTIIDETDKEE